MKFRRRHCHSQPEAPRQTSDSSFHCMSGWRHLGRQLYKDMWMIWVMCIFREYKTSPKSPHKVISIMRCWGWKNLLMLQPPFGQLATGVPKSEVSMVLAFDVIEFGTWGRYKYQATESSSVNWRQIFPNSGGLTEKNHILRAGQIKRSIHDIYDTSLTHTEFHPQQVQWRIGPHRR